MTSINLHRDETILAKAKAQIAEGLPQTAGDLYLTNLRLVLVPDQFASLGFGRLWEAELARIIKVEQLGHFEGGTVVGGVGKKLVIQLDDSTQQTFAFYLNSDIDAFYQALVTQLRQNQ
jgi:hypothetical protein